MAVSLERTGVAGFYFRDPTPSESERIARMTGLNFILDYWFAKHISTQPRGTPERRASAGEHFRLMMAPTGSGKASVGPELYMRYFEAHRRNIAVLQPTIATATDIPRDILKVPKYGAVLTMGKNIGYQTGLLVRKPVRGVVFMTIGVLSAMLLTMDDAAFMRKFQFIVVDEAHTRREELDLLLYMLKGLVARNIADPLCPFIIAMSGTMPAEKYAAYLGVDRGDVIKVEATSFARENHFLDAPSRNVWADTAALVAAIHNKIGAGDAPERGDIIVFISGANYKKLIEAALPESVRGTLLIASIDSPGIKAGSDLVLGVLRFLEFATTKDARGHTVRPTRRLIFATPAIETGMTVPSAKYCIDLLVEFAVQFNPIYGFPLKAIRPIPRTAAEQRRGRIGRKFPGHYYPMCTAATFDHLAPEKEPDVIAGDITRFLLNLIISDTMPADWMACRDFRACPSALKSFDLTAFDLMDAPSVDSINYSLEKLFVLGFIDGRLRPTPLALVSRFFHKLPLECLRMLLEGLTCGANLDDLITLAAVLDGDIAALLNHNSKKGPVYSPALRGAMQKKGGVGRDGGAGSTDIACEAVELVLAYCELRTQIQLVAEGAAPVGGLRKWAEGRGLVYDEWLYAIGRRDDLLAACAAVGLDPYRNGLGIARYKYDLLALLQDTPAVGLAEVQKLKTCIYAGFRLSTATWSAARGAYVHDFAHVPLASMSRVADSRPDARHPARVVVFGAALSTNKKTEQYQFAFSAASALDGVVDIDPSFAAS